MTKYSKQLPDNVEIYLSKKEAAAKLGLSIRSIDKKAQSDPTFPKPIVWGDERQSRVRYKNSELDDWMESRPKEKSIA